jgi:hypothetical protein
MKKFLILILFLPQLSIAERAMVIVLETPIFRAPAIDSKIVQYARKGSIIYVDRRDLKDDPTALTQKKIKFEDSEIPVPSSGKQRWYKTLDRNGMDAYVLGSHIKVIYNDFREFNEKVSVEGHDPTDYRLREPLPDKFPFTEGYEFRFNLTFGLGPGEKARYNYNAPISREDYSIRNAFGINVHWPEAILKQFRLGINAGFYNQKRRFYLSDGKRASNESGGALFIGPSINYDQFKGKGFQITYTAALTFNWSRYSVEQETLNTMEERIFNGMYLTPKVLTAFQWQKIFFDNTDLLIQLEGVFDYPHSLTSGSTPVLTYFWTEGNDKISVPGGASFLVYFGLQAKI